MSNSSHRAKALDPRVEQALTLLREGRADSVSEAARATGAARTTVRDNWHDEQGGPADTPDNLRTDLVTDASEIPVFYRDYSSEPHHFVYPLGDVHKGAPQHQRARWREWLGYVQGAENTSMLGTGDFLNCATKVSPSELYDEKQGISESKWELARELEPLAENGDLDALIRGNHEDRVWRLVGEDPIYDVSQHLGVNYSPATCIVIYRVGDVNYTFDVRHGKGAGQIGARANRLKRLAQTVICDVYVSGHTHSQLVFPDDVFDVDIDAQSVIRRKQMFVSSGSFLAYEDYASTAGFNPTHIGAPRIRLDGRRKDVHVSV